MTVIGVKVLCGQIFRICLAKNVFRFMMKTIYGRDMCIQLGRATYEGKLVSFTSLGKVLVITGNCAKYGPSTSHALM
jgi:hypothetical protein